MLKRCHSTTRTHSHKNVPTPPVQGRAEISRTSKILQELTAPLHFLRISSCVYSGPQKFTTRAHRSSKAAAAEAERAGAVF